MCMIVVCVYDLVMCISGLYCCLLFSRWRGDEFKRRPSGNRYSGIMSNVSGLIICFTVSVLFRFWFFPLPSFSCTDSVIGYR